MIPTKPADSVLAVPPSAVVALSSGPAVFTPLRNDRYVAMPVVPRHQTSDGVVIDGDISGSSSVVVEGLQPPGRRALSTPQCGFPKAQPLRDNSAASCIGWSSGARGSLAI